MSKNLNRRIHPIAEAYGLSPKKLRNKGAGNCPLIIYLMKIEYTEGCICYGLDVDGVPETELSDTEREKSWKKVLSYLKKEGNPDDLNELLQWVMPRYGISEHQYTCSQCGDSVYVTSLEF